MIIEACWGLGEALVQGIVTPDSYVIEKSKLKLKTENLILDKNISKQKIMIVREDKGTKKVKVPKIKQLKQKLSAKKIFELAKICLKIERHYKEPQDIEWALKNNKFYILQSRPITAL
jgi:pyruvate,water dikinase